MTIRRGRLVLLVAMVVVVIVVAVLLLLRCPTEGLALTSNARALHRLKNRTVLPREVDFNPHISLNELLKPGDDRLRWSTQQAARIQGHVVAVAYARPEATNCFVPWRCDIHINIATRKDAPLSEQVVLEVTPNFRDWAFQQGWDWSESALRAQILDHWVEFEGWMFFDEGHAEESENIAPNNPANWRATAWEIHPITKFKVLR
jgi:hypothetical protein